MGDQDNTSSATAHLFAPIQAPRIKNISRKAVQDFLADREAYEDAINAQSGLIAVSYRSCFPAMYLKSLVRARVFGAEIKEVTQLTDEIIKAKLQEIAGKTKTVSVDEALADVKRNVKLDASESDARLRIVMLSASYLELCEKRGWKFVETSQKAAIKHIISVLQPPKLKTRVEDALQLEKADLKNDYFGFMDFLADKAEIFEEVQPLREYRQSQSRNRDSNKGTDKKGNPSPSPSNKGKDAPNKVSPTTDPKKDKKTLPRCLNPACSENHLLKDCSKTSKEQAKKLLEEYREKKKKDNKPPNVSALLSSAAAAEPTKRVSSGQSTNEQTAVVQAELGGFKFACRIDSGADVTGISDVIVNFLGDNGIFLPTRFLSRPEKLLAIDGHTVMSKGTAQINPLLQTSAGPCRLRNVNVKILEDSSTYVSPGNDCAGEIVLGNSFLIASGLDVTDFLAKNVERLASIDFGDLDEENPTAKVGKLGFKLLSQEIDICDEKLQPSKLCSMIYNGDFPLKDGDDIDYKDVEVGIQDEEEFKDAINAMISRCRKYLSRESIPILTNLVDEFKDIFRVNWEMTHRLTSSQ